MQRKDVIIIRKVISEMEISIKLLGDTSLNDFEDSELMKRAICMTVINIGELIKSLSMDTRKQFPHIPWKAMAGFRDITAHRYQTLKMEDVYVTVHDEFPAILSDIKAILTET